jgi:maltooligosyltrehalose trehalohydrolase
VVALHRDLIRLRREAPAFSSGRRDRLFGAVLGENALILRFVCPEGDRALVVNLGNDLTLGSVPEPLLAPPLGQRWRTSWSSEDPRYGGDGVAPVETDEGFRIPGRAAVVLEPERIG